MIIEKKNLEFMLLLLGVFVDDREERREREKNLLVIKKKSN